MCLPNSSYPQMWITIPRAGVFFYCQKVFFGQLACSTENWMRTRLACEAIASESDAGEIDYGFAIGSRPLFLIASNASRDAKKSITLRAASESVVLAAMPAENTDTFCTSGGNGVM